MAEKKLTEAISAVVYEIVNNPSFKTTSFKFAIPDVPTTTSFSPYYAYPLVCEEAIIDSVLRRVVKAKLREHHIEAEFDIELTPANNHQLSILVKIDTVREVAVQPSIAPRANGTDCSTKAAIVFAWLVLLAAFVYAAWANGWIPASFPEIPRVLP